MPGSHQNCAAWENFSAAYIGGGIVATPRVSAGGRAIARQRS
jgi:hypothetical protein